MTEVVSMESLFDDETQDVQNAKTPGGEKSSSRQATRAGGEDDTKGHHEATKWVESGGKRNAVGPETKYGTAKGEMQVIDSTARDPGHGIAPAKNLEDRARVGNQLLDALYKKYGNWDDAHIAYNWGEGNADKWIARGRDESKLPAETRNYVQEIHRYLGQQTTREAEGRARGEPQVVSMASLFGGEGEESPAKEKKPEVPAGKRLLGDAAGLGDLALGILTMPPALGANVGGRLDSLVKGQSTIRVEPKTEEQLKAMSPEELEAYRQKIRESFSSPWAASGQKGAEYQAAVSAAIGDPLKKLMAHFGQEEPYNQSGVNTVMGKISELLDRGTKAASRATGISENDLSLVRDTLMTFGPVEAAKGVGKRFKGKPIEAPPAGGEGAVGKYEQEGVREDTPELPPKPQGGPPIPPYPLEGPISQRTGAPPPAKPEPAPRPPLGSQVGNTPKTSLQEPTTLGGKEPPAPPKPIYTGLDRATGKFPRRQIAGSADIKLLAGLGLVAGGAAAAAYYTDGSKLEAAIAGGLAGLIAARAPEYAARVSNKWERYLTIPATAAGLTAVGAWLDDKHPFEGALLGLLYGFSQTWKGVDLAKVNGVTIDDLVRARDGGVRVRERETWMVSQAIRELVPKQDRQEHIARMVDEGKTSTLSGNELRAAHIYKGFTKSFGAAAKDVGLLDDLLDNYVTHVVDRLGAPKTRMQEALDAVLGRGDKAPGGNSNSRFTFNRKHATLADLHTALEGTGLKIRTLALPELVDIYGRSMGRAIENKMFIDTLKAHYSAPIEGSGRLPYIMEQAHAPVGYKTINSPQMGGLAVHDELAQPLRNLLEKDDPSAIRAGLEAGSMATKRLATSYSFFHTSNLFQALASANGYAWTAGEVARGFPATRAALREFEKGGLGGVIDEGLRHGLVVDPPMDASTSALTSLGKAADILGERLTGLNPGIGERVLKGLETVQRNVFDRVTWDWAHRGFKLATFIRQYEKAISRNPGMDRADAAKQVASFVNKTFGGMDWNQVAAETQSYLARKIALSAVSPKGRSVMQMMMFAPDWTVSTFQSLYKALPGSGTMPLTRRLHQQYVMRAALLYFTAMNGYNYYASGGKWIWENKNKDGSPDPFRIHWADGAKQQMFKHASEGPEWLIDPRQQMMNKMGFFLKEPLELLTGKEYLSTHGAPNIQSNLEHLATSIAPIPLQGATNPVPGRTVGESLKRGVASSLGAPIYGMTRDEAKENSKEKARLKRERDRKKREH